MLVEGIYTRDIGKKKKKNRRADNLSELTKNKAEKVKQQTSALMWSSVHALQGKQCSFANGILLLPIVFPPQILNSRFLCAAENEMSNNVADVVKSLEFGCGHC